MHRMTQPLENITVAVLEHRYTKEFSGLFERLGATVHACPLLEEKPVENRGELHGRRVGVQLYGTPNPQLVSALEAKGATVTPVQVYAYGAAADASAVGELIARILDGQIDVMAFTSAPQVNMLFDFATQLGR